MASDTPITICLVEDDPGHARLIERYFQRAGVPHNIVTWADGQAALADITRRAEEATPMLVLLDLNLPGLDGYQILARLKGNERTRLIPVCVLTSTDDPREVKTCYAMGCNIYVTKPVEYRQFVDTIQYLGAFFSVLTVPGGG